MNHRKTYLDSGVLIAVARTSDEIATRAIEILDNPDRQFASSSFVRLEVLAKATYLTKEKRSSFTRLSLRVVRYGRTIWLILSI